MNNSKFVPLIYATILSQEAWLTKCAQSGLVLSLVKGHRFFFKRKDAENIGYFLMPQGLRGYDPDFGKLSIELGDLSRSKRPLYNKHESPKVNRINVENMNLEVFSYDISLEELVSEIKLRRNRYLFKQRLQLLIAYASAGSFLIITWILSLRSLPVFGFLLLMFCNFHRKN